MQIKEYKQKIVDLSADPNNPNLVKNMLKEKDIEIQILKKKLKIPKGHHIQSPELLFMQAKRDEFYKDMLKYKERVTQYQIKSSSTRKEWL